MGALLYAQELLILKKKDLTLVSEPYSTGYWKPTYDAEGKCCRMWPTTHAGSTTRLAVPSLPQHQRVKSLYAVKRYFLKVIEVSYALYSTIESVNISHLLANYYTRHVLKCTDN